MSETFAFDVAFDTTFEQVEALRDKMLAFVKSQSRDFLPSFDVVVVGVLHTYASHLHKSLTLVKTYPIRRK